MSKASTYQCPNCNGVLHFDPESGHLICDFCGGSFEQGEFEKDIPVSAEAVERQDVAHVKTVDEFLERAPWATLADGQAGAVAYSCSACGAHVVADQAAVTAALSGTCGPTPSPRSGSTVSKRWCSRRRAQR